ncbi:MAG TPA: hypothetical protein VIF62_31535 [Labilithrix sp.]
MRTRTRILLVAGFAIGALAVARYATFDAVAWSDDVADRMSPFSGGTLDAQQTRWTETMKAMRTRFHPGDGACVRYGALAPPSLEVIREAAEAIVDAGLARELDGLVADALRWRMEEDDKLHAEAAAAEAFDFFSAEAAPWERVGVWMHRNAARDALHTRLAPHIVERHVKPESEPRARAIATRFGPYVTNAAFQVAKGMRNVDLGGERLRWIRPGMSADDVEARLGPPDERKDSAWTWREPATEVLFDDGHEVAAIARTLSKSSFDASLVLGEETIVARDDASIVAKLGAPAWTHDDDDERELVWDAGAARRRLVFESGTLARVELWKRDRLAPR